MRLKTKYAGWSYRSFLRALESILATAGVTLSRNRITAEEKPGRDQLTSPTKQELPKVGQVILYMEKHLNEELSLEQLAEQVQLSKYQLIRRFRKEMKTTPWKYLLNRRLKRAKQLLELGMPPGQVAMETGFYDQSHLNKAFRDESGSTPKEYQEKNFANRN